MKIENQVCTLEQAKKLKELGVEQNISLYVWAVYCPDPVGEKYFYIVMDENHPEAQHAEFISSAFTVAELGVMLPNYYYAMRKINNPSLIEEWICESGENGLACVSDTQAECLAEMLIYLLENHLTTPEEVNQRLNN